MRSNSYLDCLTKSLVRHSRARELQLYSFKTEKLPYSIAIKILMPSLADFPFSARPPLLNSSKFNQHSFCEATLSQTPKKLHQWNFDTRRKQERKDFSNTIVWNISVVKPGSNP